MNLNNLFDSLDADQLRAGQLPADFAPPQTSPQLQGPYPGKNATRGHLVGENHVNSNRFQIGDPVIITGDVEFKGKTGDVREVGRDGAFVVVDLYNYGPHSFHSTDVSYNDYADSDDEAEYQQGVAEGVEIVDQDSDLDQQVFTLNVDGETVSFTYWDYENNFQSPDIKDIYQQAREQLGKKLSPEQIKAVARSVFKSFKSGVAEGNDHSLKKVWDRYSKHLMAARGDHPDVGQINKSGAIVRNIRKYVKDHHGQKALDDMERYAEKQQWNEGVSEGSDISGLMAAASMVQDYIITAEVDGQTKRFRVRGMTGPTAARERFLKHASQARVIDVKPVAEKSLNEFEMPVGQATGAAAQIDNKPKKTYSIKVVGTFKNPTVFMAKHLWSALEEILPRDYPRVPYQQQHATDPQRRVIDDINDDGFAIVKQGIKSLDIANTIASNFEARRIPAEVISGGLYEDESSQFVPKPGDEILWRPRNAKMAPVPVTVLAINAEKIKIKLQSARLIQQRGGKDTMVVSRVTSEIMPKQSVAEASPMDDPDFAAGLAAAHSGAGPLGIMLAQPSIANNQQLLNTIASSYNLPAGMSAQDIRTQSGSAALRQALDDIARNLGLPTGLSRDELLTAFKKQQASGQGVAEGWGTDQYHLFQNGYTVLQKKQTARPGEPEFWLYQTPGVASQEEAEAVIRQSEPVGKFGSLRMALDSVRNSADNFNEANNKKSNPRIERILRTLRAQHPQAENDLEALIFDFRDQQRRDRTDIARLDIENDQEEADIDQLEQSLNALRRRKDVAAMESIEEKLSRQMAAEDVLGAVKRRLGDYLGQVQQRKLKHAEKFPERVTPQDILGNPVKKIDLGNGKVLMIHGNEDDGFRIHLGQRVMPTKFATLGEAEMAMQIYEARRQQSQSTPLVNETTAGSVAAVSMPIGNAIRRGIDEKKDACYNKVRSRYKVWPSAYASGALVQCRKKGADNWGEGGKKK